MLITKELHYTLNYKPFLGVNKEIKNHNLIYCKNFFLFFLIIDNLLTSINKKKDYKLTIFKSKKNNVSFLRAPNKYKKAQIKISLIRYHVIFKINKDYSNIHLNLLKNKIFLFNFIDFLFNFIDFFESSLFVLRKKKISIIFNKKSLVSFFEL